MKKKRKAKKGPIIVLLLILILAIFGSLNAFSDVFKKEIEDSTIPGTEAYKRMEKIGDEIMKNIEEGNPFIGL